MAAKNKSLPYVKRVTSNIKSPDGNEWSVDLGQKTLILGSNTSRKSAILQAVELAVSGAADDIVGRYGVRDPSLLLTLAPMVNVGEDKLHSSASFSDESMDEATFSVERSGSRVKKPFHSTPFDASKVMPSRLVRLALSGGEKTARKSFLEWTADGVSDEDVLARISTNLHAKYKDISDKLSKGGDNGTTMNAVEKLLATIEYAGKQQRDSAKQLKGAEAALESVGDELPACPTKEDLAKAESLCAEAQSVFDEAVKAHSLPTNKEIEVQFNTANVAAQQLKEKMNGINKEYAVLMDNARIAEISGRLFEWSVKNEKENCPACNANHGLEHNRVLFDHWQNVWASETQAVQQQADELKARFDEVSEILSQRAVELNQIASLRGRGRDDEPGNEVISLEEAKQQLERCQQNIVKLSSDQNRWNDLSRMQDTVRAMSLQIDTYKVLKSECEKAVGELLAHQAPLFSDLVTTYLPDGWIFGIDLKDGSREVFRMGLRRGDKLHSALSGAESIAVVSAIAMASIDTNKSPRIIIPADRAWDSNTLRNVMDSFADFPGQVIIATTTKHARKKPRGWTIINADDLFGSAEVTELEVKEETPSTESGVSVRSAQILEGMGFETTQVQRMTSETAADIIRQGLKANQVTVTKGGKYRVIKKDNVLPMN
tara:strand:+ start:423 stop:2402 length:1980 start_codon:yes stop_codon:yes gene_type:complete